jgi:hypothetical protein
MSVTEWEDGKVLTWSGKWHTRYPMNSRDPHQVRTLCGAYGYTFEGVPRYVRRLMDITNGVKPAPLCKKCARYPEQETT